MNGSNGIYYTKIRDDTTSIPDEAARTVTFGENVPMGALESIVIRITTVNTTNAILADFGNVISNLRLTLNGDVFFDFRQAVSGGDNNNPSSIGLQKTNGYLGGGKGMEIKRIVIPKPTRACVASTYRFWRIFTFWSRSRF